MDEHDAVRSLLAGFIAGALQADDSERVRRHLDGCADCAQNAAVLQRLVQMVQRLPGDVPGPACLARITDVARAHRAKVLESRRQAGLTVAVALLGWVMAAMTLPLWQWLAGVMRVWSGWKIPADPLAAFALGALLSCLFLPGIWAMLERVRVARNGEVRQ